MQRERQEAIVSKSTKPKPKCVKKTKMVEEDPNYKPPMTVA